MSVNIDLGTFTFDSAAVEKSLEATKKKMFELKQEQEDYRKENKELNDQLKRLGTAQELVAKTAGTQSKAYKDLEKEVATLNKKKEELFKKELNTRQEVSKTNKEYRETTKILGSLTDAEGKRLSTSEAVNNALQRENRSIAEARESNKELLALRNQLDLTTDEGIKSMEELNDKLNENNQFIKESVSGYEQQKINIGDYENAVKNAIDSSGLFSGELAQIKQILSGLAPVYNLIKTEVNQATAAMKGNAAATTGMSNAQKAAAATTQVLAGALKILRLALIATGIGAIVVALGSLIAFLSTTQAGIDKVTSVTRPLTEVFQSLFGVVQKVGEALFNAFANPQDTLDAFLDQLKPLGTIMEGIANRDFSQVKKGFAEVGEQIKENVESIKQAGREFAETMEEAYERGQQIDKLTKNLAKTEADFITSQARLRKEFEEQKKLADDLSQSAEVREQAAQEAIRLQEEISKGSIERIKQEGEILRLKQMSNDTSDAERAQLATKLAEIDRVIQEEASKTKEAQNKLNSIRKEGNTKAIELIKQRQDAAIAANEQELELYLANQGIGAKTMQEQLEVAKKVAEEEKKILDQKLEYKKITELEYQAAILNIQNEYLELQRDLVIENAEREREAILSEIEKRKTDYQDFTQERLNFEIQNSQDILEEQQRFAALQLEQGAITEQEYQDAINTIRDEARIREEESRLIFEEADKERKLIDAQNQLDLDELDFNNRFEVKAARLELQRQQEVEAARKTGADVTKINEYYAEQQLKIEAEKENAKAQMAADTYGAISSILGKETAAGKAFALAQALINTYQGISAGVALGFPAAIPAVAAATATGFAAVKNIAKTKAEKGYVSDRKGTVLKGARHSGGGIMIEAEDGEPILTRKAFQLFPELISQINVAGGGVPLAARGMVAGNSASNNSMVQKNLTGMFDMSSLTETISDGVRQGAKEGSAIGASQGSQEGLIGLSDNRQIQTQSAF